MWNPVEIMGKVNSRGMTSPTCEAVRGRVRWVALGVILLATIVTYRGVPAHDFVLDDAHTVKYNPAVQSLTRWLEWITSPYAVSGNREYANYRPVLVASYALDYAFWRGTSAGYHASNLAIHLGVVVLGFALARRLWRDDAAALCAVGLIALHPINAEAVNYLTARSSSLMTVFVLAAIWASERASQNRLWSVAAYGLGLAALGTKEAAVVLPVLIMVWDRATRDGSWAATVKRVLPWCVLVGAFLVLRAWVLGGHAAVAIHGPGVTIGQHLLFAVKIYLASIGHWIRPTGLAVDHAWPFLIGVREAAALIVGAAALLIGTGWALRAHPKMGWCLVWFWAAIWPAGAVAFVSRFTLYQDNRVYLAGIGLSWLAGAVLAAVGRSALGWTAASGGGRRVTVVRLALAAAVLGGVASAVRADAVRTAAWSNTTTLWDDVLAQYPRSVIAHNVKGMRSLEAGDLDGAYTWFERALYLAPGFAEAHKNMGLVFARLGDWERAAAAFEFALKIAPTYSEARVNLGKVYEEVRRTDLAFEVYDRVLRDDPVEPTALRKTAMLLEQRGDLEEAATRYRRLLAIDPNDAEARRSLAMVLLRAGRGAEAGLVFEALTPAPDS